MLIGKEDYLDSVPGRSLDSVPKAAFQDDPGTMLCSGDNKNKTGMGKTHDFDFLPRST